MSSILTLVGTLVAGVILIAIGAADLFTAERLTLAGDLGFVIAGAGALGVHVQATKA
ncbi:MAG: hypothetical protein JWM85_3607 [Acidimicrobiaceae bacterium]|nr:hypothetical protein [Acidimicrobiaceae bacterium]